MLTEIKYKELNKVQKIAIDGITSEHKRSEMFLRTKVTVGLVLVSTGVALLVGVVSFIGRPYASNGGGSLRSSYLPKRVFPYIVCDVL